MFRNNKVVPALKYFIKGLHCASCEMIIEKRLKKERGVISADVNLRNNTLNVSADGNCAISENYLNFLFKDDNYQFSVKPFSSKAKIIKSECEVACDEDMSKKTDYMPYIIGGLVLIVLYLVKLTGVLPNIQVNSGSALPAFFLLGLIAGVSSCAALVGGIILSLSKQWHSAYKPGDSMVKKSEPHILFNVGRVLGYGLFGAILGYIGTFFQLSPFLSASLVIVVSIVMVLLGLQMLGVKALAGFQPRLPKSLTNKFSNEENFQGRFGPFTMGALTFFLPCGFTVTAQAVALASGDPIQGALIMSLFALGTVPGLLAIGLGSIKMLSDPKRSIQFSKVAGALVIFFALFNFNAQLTVLGVSNFSDLANSVSALGPSVKGASTGNLVPIVGGIQIIKIDADSSGYTPNKIRIKVGVPTRIEITDTGASGCTNVVISKLWDDQISLINGTTSTKEFTPTKAGVYKFSCWMGMVSGTIEVVDDVN